MRRTTLRRISYGTGAALTGVLLFPRWFAGLGPRGAFWHPLRTWRDARAPVRWWSTSGRSDAAAA